MSELTANNSAVYTYADRCVNTGTIGTVAKQFMFCANQTQSGSTLAGTKNYLHLDDPMELADIISSISANKTARMTRQSCKKRVTLTNLNTADVDVYHYRCKARQDSELSPEAVLIQGFADSSATGLGSTPASSIMFGATPFMNNRFTALYKIVGVKKRTLAPSQTWKLSFKTMKPRMFAKERISPNGNTFDILKGQSISVFVAQGTFAANPNADVTKRYGVGNVDLGMVCTGTYHYSWTNDISSASGVTQDLYGFTREGTATTGPHQAVPIVMNQPMSSISDGANVAGSRQFDTATISNGYPFCIPGREEMY